MSCKTDHCSTSSSWGYWWSTCRKTICNICCTIQRIWIWRISTCKLNSKCSISCTITQNICCCKISLSYSNFIKSLQWTWRSCDGISESLFTICCSVSYYESIYSSIKVFYSIGSPSTYPKLICPSKREITWTTSYRYLQVSIWTICNAWIIHSICNCKVCSINECYWVWSNK